MTDGEKGFNITSLDFVPSLFSYYSFKKMRVRDMSISQTINLSILNGAPDLAKLIEIYAPSFLSLTIEQVNNLLYVDFIACVHLINHLTFGVYNNSFSRECPICNTKSKIEYSLYDIDFNKMKQSKFEGNVGFTKDCLIVLKPFTAGLMAELIALGLDSSKEAFIASCIESVYLKGEYCNDFTDMESKINSLNTYPFRFKKFLTDEIAKRYPEVKPITSIPPCGHSFQFVPDMTLKGLPTFTSI